MVQLPSLPTELYQQFAPVFGQLAHTQQSDIADIAHSLFTHTAACEKFVELLLRYPEQRNVLIAGILPHSVQHRIDLVALFHASSTALVTSILTTATETELHRLLRLIDCFEDADFSQMLKALEDLSYAVFMRLLTDYPRPKPCHMCMVQRQTTDQYLLINELPWPKRAAETWHADRDEMIQFNFKTTQVLYSGICIDLANTCPVCLDRIRRCLADVGRNQELWQLPPAERPNIERKLRKDEQNAAAFFQVLHRSQALRECKRWIQDVFERARLTQFQLEKADKQAIAQKVAAKKAMKDAQAKTMMIKSAMRSEARSKAHEMKRIDQVFHQQRALAILQAYPNFRSNMNGNHPNISACREDKLSYRLSHHTAEGVPLTAEGAAHTFGHAPLKRQDSSRQLAQWKRSAVKVDHEREKERTRKESHDTARETARLREYVTGRLEKLDLKQLVAKSQGNDQQQRYLEERRRKKELYRLEQLRAIERDENYKMHQEEKRMRLWLCREKRRVIEERELARMRVAEKEQTLVDQFWGIPTLIASLRKEDYERQHRYEVHVENMRRTMATLGHSKHTRWQPRTEVKVKFTDKLIPHSTAT